MASDFSELMKENGRKYVACGKMEAINFLIARAAKRGEKSELLDDYDLSKEDREDIYSMAYKDNKQLYPDGWDLSIGRSSVVSWI